MNNIDQLRIDLETANKFISQWTEEKKKVLKKLREIPERKVWVRIIRKGKTVCEESVLVNALNRVTLYNAGLGLVDCGAEGDAFEELYRDVERVVFTSEEVYDNRGTGKLPVVVVYGF